MVFCLAIVGLVQTVTLEPSDDLWVYPHASDQVNDPFLRVWGAEGKSLADDMMEANAFSYAYLRFPITRPSTGKSIKTAKLVLTMTPHASWGESLGKTYPLEVRMVSKFPEEGTWRYDSDLPKFMPQAGETGLVGKVQPSLKREGDIVVEIELKVGSEKLKAATESGSINLALVSSIDPAAIGERIVYKFYSRSAESGKRPKLVVTFE
jgi:hypothetical protein